VTGDVARLLKLADVRNADAVFAACARALRVRLEAEALPLLEAAAARHPGDARIWQLLGLAQRALDDLEPALFALGKAASLAPTDPLIGHALARATLEAGLPATDLYARALRLAPNDGPILLGRAAAQLAAGRIGDAMAGLSDELRRNPSWLPGHGSLCRMRWLNGERDSFDSSFEAAAAARPREAAIWREWAETLMQAGRHDSALALLARGRAAAGQSPMFDTLEAAIVAEHGEPGRADRLFAALGPIEHVILAVRYVRYLLRAGRPAEASAFAEPWLATEEAEFLWPYAAAAWRLTGDERLEWLEGEPSLVGVYDIGDSIPSLDRLAEHLRGLHVALDQPLDQSVRGGTQTDGPLFSRIDPEIRTLRSAIVAAVERHIAQLPAPRQGHPTLLARRGPVRFAGSWSVRLAGGGRHSNHIHPAGWISSAFYVALPQAATDGDQAGWLTLGEPEAELGLDLPPVRTIKPKPGRLVLFPSTMWHGTLPFAAGERLTVAFDVARPTG
jgi:tetratricopeptide (TPR) repeat protein